jgi:hypothetical protein
VVRVAPTVPMRRVALLTRCAGDRVAALAESSPWLGPCSTSAVGGEPAPSTLCGMHGTDTDKIARTRAYRGGDMVAEDFPVANISDYIAERDTVVWVDLCAPDTVDLKVVAEELGLHELAVERICHCSLGR